jgi:hypothetical protein
MFVVSVEQTRGNFGCVGWDPQKGLPPAPDEQIPEVGQVSGERYEARTAKDAYLGISEDGSRSGEVPDE